MGERLEEFRKFREKMNEKILGSDNLEIKRFFARRAVATLDEVEELS